MTARARAALILLVLASFGVADRTVRAETPLTTVRIAQGLAKPLYVTAPPGDTSRIFIVEQRGADARGRIKIYKNGAVLARPFLTTAALATGSEQGLLGLAFAPDYATSGRFFINYTRADGTTILERRTVSADPDSASPTAVTILSVAQPFANHNGGWLAFGPDGYLYVSMGDGGSGGDPGDRAQNLNTLLGKILRLDVSGVSYTSPPSNPFAGALPGRDEIWAYGLRNPWRPSFDRLTGDLIIADVGQSAKEEIDFQLHSSTGGENYGWRCYEADNFYAESDSTPCDSCRAPACPKEAPIFIYDHSLSRCSITGGFVYRGCAIPDLRGTYFFADYCSGAIYSGTATPDTLVGWRDRTAQLAPGGGLSIGSITSFGEDARGELYICDGGGEVFKIVPAAPVAEADMPVLRQVTAKGDTLGATTPGNALLPGVTAFADAGNRIRGVGYMKNATIRDCAGAATGCLASRLKLGAFDVDLDACVDPVGRLTRRFIFTNRSASPQTLAYVDVITPRLNGDADGATTTAPPSPDSSPGLVLYDSFQPTSYVRHWGVGSSGVSYGADVDTASQVVARVAADAPLAGGVSAGPAAVGLALSFSFGSVAPAAAETVTVYTELVAGAPVGVVVETPAAPRAVLHVGPVPFRTELHLGLSLMRDEEAAVEVFDARGRMVRRLLRRSLPAGEHSLTWDGRTGSGREAPAGIYFVRYRSGSVTEVRRAVRLR